MLSAIFFNSSVWLQAENQRVPFCFIGGLQTNVDKRFLSPVPASRGRKRGKQGFPSSPQLKAVQLMSAQPITAQLRIEQLMTAQLATAQRNAAWPMTAQRMQE